MTRAWLIWFALLFALYLLLVDTVLAPELGAGVVAAAAGATGAVLVRGQRRLILRPRPRHFAQAVTPLLRLFGDLPLLARVLVTRGILRRPETGRLEEAPFSAVADTPEDATERAFTEALGSLAPAEIVVAIDHERGVLLRHRL